MVKVNRDSGKRSNKANDRSKSRTVSKRNLSRKELNKVKDKKRSEKQVKNEKKKELLKKQRQKEKDERHKRFLPGVYQAEEKKKEVHHSEDEEDEHAVEVFDNEGFYQVPDSIDGITKEDEELIKTYTKLQTNKPTTDLPEAKEEEGDKNSGAMTLADLIMQKMNANQEKQIDKYDIDELEQGVASTMDPKIVKVYRVVGSIMAKYISGKIPKPFKVIPALANWQDIVFLTKPFRWSPQAMFEATKIFAANFKAPMAQQFYNLVLLPTVRSDIDKHNKLGYHYYMSVKKSVFKPSAFFKGFLLPLAQDCSAREAAIIGSILIKVSLPVLHAAAALLKMCEYEYSIGTSYFIKVLLGKNYALPSRVIDGVVNYFYSFCEEGLEEYDEEEVARMPVLWHQSLMIFVQKYKRHMTDEQKKKLKLVMRVRFNPHITPEIRKELFMNKEKNSMAID